MKKLLTVCIIALLSMFLFGCSDEGNNDTKDQFKIGVILISDHQALIDAKDGFLDKLEALGVDFTADIQNAQGEQTICTTIATKFVNDKVDLILAVATPAAQATAQATSDIPILVTAVTDPASSGLVESNEQPNTNVSGTSDLNPVEAQIDLLLDFVPNAKNIGIMYCSSEDNSILQANLAESVIKNKGLTALHFTAADSSEVQSVAQSMIGKVDAVYIPTDNLMADTISATSVILTDANIPVIAGEANMVTGGALATYGIDYYKLGELTAVQAEKILVQKQDIKTMPIEYMPKEFLTFSVNEDTLNNLGLTMPEELK